MIQGWKNITQHCPLHRRKDIRHRPGRLRRLRLIELPYGKDVIASQKVLKERHPGLVTIIRMEISPDSSGSIVQLTAEGAEVIHLVADDMVMNTAMNPVMGKADKPLFIKERMREIHLHLVEKGSVTRSLLSQAGASPWLNMRQS